MAYGRHTTIAALATPPGPARRGILRVSGPRAAELVEGTLRGAHPAFVREAARQLVRGHFDDGGGLQPVVLLWMRGPRSFTAEDVAEFHLPGAEVLLGCALARLLALGAAAARPGEFTRRAFLNGRLDLSRAEGVLAMTEAGNEAERAAAALLLDGGLAARSEGIRERLLELTMLCEASLDFDEADTGHVPRAELEREFTLAEQALDEACAWEERRAAPSSLPRVVLMGAPNAGKSSLWNALTGGRALVAPEAGTTRDALQGEWPLAGLTCLLVDGPGLEREARGTAGLAQELFARQRRQADLRLWVADSGAAAPTEIPDGVELLVWNKIDLPGADLRRPSSARTQPEVRVSARTGAGLEELAHTVGRLLGEGLGRGGIDGGEATGLPRILFARHKETLLRARSLLGESRALLAAGAPLDLLAECLRASLSALDELSGRTTPEDVLDRIFARFCLGK